MCRLLHISPDHFFMHRIFRLQNMAPVPHVPAEMTIITCCISISNFKPVTKHDWPCHAFSSSLILDPNLKQPPPPLPPQTKKKMLRYKRADSLMDLLYTLRKHSQFIHSFAFTFFMNIVPKLNALFWTIYFKYVTSNAFHQRNWCTWFYTHKCIISVC